MKNLFTLVAISSLIAITSLVQAQDTPVHKRYQRDTIPHPVIQDILSEVNQDSLAAHITFLQNMGTRFQYAENRKQVAEWIAARFRSYGVTHAALDSFRIAGDTVLADSVWQYNVVATLQGTSAPDEIYILGAHHDDFSNTNMYLNAPGANDNASGCAVAFEFARICQKKHVQLSSTIRLITFAAEELTGYKHYGGSIDYANKLNLAQQDLRLMINNDMVANTTGAGYEIIASYIDTEKNRWAGELTLFSAAVYSTLEVLPRPYPTSDATHFSELGYCVAGFQQYGMDVTYHTIHDSVSNCNMNLCYEAAKATCAILLNEQLTPVPQELTSFCGKQNLTLSWKPTLNDNVAGFQIYRSPSPDTGYVQIAAIIGLTSEYTDTTVVTGQVWYYRVTSKDDTGFESLPSNVAKGALTPHDRALLVVKDSKGGCNDPEDPEVMGFYTAIFDGLDPDLSDASETDSLDIAILGRYEKICWFSNTWSNQPGSAFRARQADVDMYLKSGGQLFLASFQPSFLTNGNTYPNKNYTSDQTVYQLYKIAAVERKPPAFLNGAYPAASPEYDTLHVDPVKCPGQTAGHLLNVECITPAPDATLIYRFNTTYDTSTTQGSMKGKPVGLEYLGPGFKVIILSVPIYYLDTADAISLVNLIVKDKFTTSIGMEEENSPGKPAPTLHLVPNPATGQTTLTFELTLPSDVMLKVFRLTGERVYENKTGHLSAGSHTFHLPSLSVAPGIYLVTLQTHAGINTAKLVIL